jgi:hypothetical protein
MAGEILATPFVVVTALSIVALPWIALATICYLHYCWWSQEWPTLLWPDVEHWMSLLGAYVVLVIGSVPLVIRDTWVCGGIDVLWEGSPQSVPAAQSYLSLLRDGNTNELNKSVANDIHRTWPTLRDVIAYREGEEVWPIAEWVEQFLMPAIADTAVHFDLVVAGQEEPSALVVLMDSQRDFALIGMIRFDD